MRIIKGSAIVAMIAIGIINAAVANEGIALGFFAGAMVLAIAFGDKAGAG